MDCRKHSASDRIYIPGDISATESETDRVMLVASKKIDKNIRKETLIRCKKSNVTLCLEPCV